MPQEIPVPNRNIENGTLAMGALAAILASTCCLGPLVLALLGVSGAWIGNLALLEPDRPLFLAAAPVAMFVAWRRLFRPRPRQHCEPRQGCAMARVRTAYKVTFWCVAVLVLIAFSFPYVAPLFY
jgi:mercuric ion transport protein